MMRSTRRWASRLGMSLAVSGVSAAVVVVAGAAAFATTSVEGNCEASVTPTATYSAPAVTVGWTDQCTNVSYYNVERSADSGATWTAVATNLAPNTLPPPSGGPTQVMSYVDTPPDCATYEYRAVAVHAPGHAAPKISISLDSNAVVIDNSGTCDGGGTVSGTCSQLSGALTLGYYSNKNGQATITGTDLADLSSLNLVDGKGNAFAPTSPTQVKNWLLNAKATNMSYMLSAQLATLELNIDHNLVNPGLTVCEDTAGRSIGQIVTDANTYLGANPVVLGGDPNRVDGDALQTLINEINNDLVTVQ